MSRFEDPNVPRSETFAAAGGEVVAPLFTRAELPGTLAALDQAAETYFGDEAAPVESLKRTLRAWTDPEGPLVRSLPAISAWSGFSTATIACFGLLPLAGMRFDQGLLEELPSRLRMLVDSGHYRRFTPWGDGHLKGFGRPELVERPAPRRVLHVLAGNVVGPSWLIAVTGAVCRCAQLVKAPSGDIASFLSFLDALDGVDPGFRRTIACGYAASSDAVLDDLYAAADAVVAMGSDTSLAAIRETLGRTNPGAVLVPHGMKIGFQVIGRDYATAEVAELTAWSVAAHDGNACFAPAAVYVEAGGALSPDAYAEAVAAHLEAICRDVPPKRTLAVAQVVRRYRQEQLKRRLLGEAVRVMAPRSSDYTVVYDPTRPVLAPTCQERTVTVAPVAEWREVAGLAAPLGDNLETAGVAVPTGDLLELAEVLGAVGVTNVKVVGSEHVMELHDPHDGVFNTVMPTLSDGLRWTALSFTQTEAALEQAQRRKRACLDWLRRL